MRRFVAMYIWVRVFFIRFHVHHKAAYAACEADEAAYHFAIMFPKKAPHDQLTSS